VRVDRIEEGTVSKEAAMCYFYGDRRAQEEARRVMREQEEARRRREEREKKAEKERVAKDRELVRA
jgi:hypothetical protein